jgi:predicted permease
MRPLHRFWLRLRSLFHRDQVERELADEFTFHLDHQIQENIDRGMSPHEARAAALRTIGGIAQLQEECRDMRRVNHIETVIADMRYAIRGFRKQPGFTILAILTLALGVGASTALFSLVNAVRLRPLPVADSERLAMLWEDDIAGRRGTDTPAPANFADWRAQNQTFEDIAAAGWLAFNLTGEGEPERLNGLRVTANYFTVLGVKPAIGRLIEPHDDNLQSGHVAVISYRLWQRRFGGNPNLINRSISLNGQPYLVVGVGPAGFQFPSNGADVWVAPGFTQQDLAQRSGHFLYVTGRLKAGVSLKQARADLATIARRLDVQFPQTNKNIGVAVVPLREYYTGDINLALNVLLAAVGALLLIVCANLAHLFLARGAARRREIAMRAALGAGRARVIRQLLTECGVLAFAAAGLGAALSTYAFSFLARLIPDSFPTGTTLHFDLTVFGFTAGVALLTALLFGIAPAFQASRVGLNEVLKLGSGRGSARGAFGRMQGVVVVTEVGLTVLLLIAAGLLVESYVRIRNVNAGFRTENVLTLETALPPGKYGDLARRAQFYRDAIEQTTQLPGVISAAYVNFPPLTFNGGSSSFYIQGRPRPRPDEKPVGFNRVATAGYLRTIGVPMLRGRFFDERDTSEEPQVMAINQAAAKAYWPGEDALGARVQFGNGGPNQLAYTIVGITGDVRQISLDVAPRPELYFPATQGGPGGSFFWPHTLVVRTAGNPLPLVAGIRRVIAAIDPDQPVANVRSMNDVLDAGVSGRQTQTAIVSTLAISALLLASVGLYGVLSYAVAQRRAEIGIRMALGAQRGEVIRGVISQALRWTALGILCGLAGAFALTRMLSALLFSISPSDPRTFTGVTLLTLGVAFVASFIPARRAATVDPVIALRQD